jgi:hypothetical protein
MIMRFSKSAGFVFRLAVAFIFGAGLLANIILSDEIRLTPGTPILVDAGEPAPVLRALRDLQRDLKTVLGMDSPIIHEPGAAKQKPMIVVTSTGAQTSRWRDSSLNGAEAHLLKTQGNAIVLHGSDARGTIYAIYEFSDRFLHIPPLWYWMGLRPSRMPAVTVPADFTLRFDSPSIRYRTWFPNDTDMLHPWLDESPAHYEAMFESLLRLKFNVLDVDYISDLPKPSRGLRWARTCRDRGIMVTSTHTAPFGIRWMPGWEPYWRLVRNQEPPAMLLENEGKFWEFWRYFIELAKRERIEMLWQIAFRGDFDKKMSLTFPDAPTDEKELASLVERILRDQIIFLKNSMGNGHLPMRSVLFEEVGQYYSDGTLTPPVDPSLVWTFGNDKTTMMPYEGQLKRRPPDGQPVGFYFNLQYTAIGSHLVEAQSPEKFQQVLALVRNRAGAPLGELMINVGNIRDFPLGISASGSIAWDFDGFAPAAFIEDYCTRYFGRAQAPSVDRIYQDLFDAYWESHAPESYAPVKRQYLFTDLKTARYIEAVLTLLSQGVYDGNPIKHPYWQGSVDPQFLGAPDQLSAILASNETMIARLDALKAKCEACAAALDAGGRERFNSTVLMPVAFLRASNRLLNGLIRAAQMLPDHPAVATKLAEAKREANRVVAILNAGDTGEFSRWHQRAGKYGFRARDYATEIDTLLARGTGGQKLLDNN